MIKQDSTRLDSLALILSGICLVHCLLLPVALTIMPILGAHMMSHGDFHALMLVIALPTSVLAFGIGCRQHRRGSVLLLGTAGLTLLVVAAFAVESTWGAEAERWITVLGGIVLAIAHVQNFRFCRDQDCAH